MRPQPGIDGLSAEIVRHLQHDGRSSFETIAAEVGRSAAAVRQRVQRLVDSGVMQIVAVTDPLQLGFTRQAMIGIKCTDDASAVADALTKIAAVDYVVLTAGTFDILAEVVCEDDDDLLNLLNNHIRTIPDVTSTETLLYLKLVKQQYNWGAR